MQLVTFGIDSNMNLVIQFPVFIQPYAQSPLILYQLETVPVPVLDLNMKAQSYTYLKIKKPYIALNSETYISLRQEELRSCKKIGYELYCKGLFIVKHKSSYSCESAIYFNLTTDIMKDNCDFDFYFNKTDVTPTVLYGGDEIILANWPNDKHIICNINNDIAIRIPSHPHVLVNRSILCNCRIEADNHHLLESIAACNNQVTKLIMHFTINLVFSNYLDMISNLTDSLLIIKDRTRYEQPLPLNLSIPHFDNSLRHRPTKLKDYMNSYINIKEIFDLQQRHATESDTFTSNKISFQSHCKYLHVHFFCNFNNYNNDSCLLILQTQTHQNNSSKLNIA